MNTVEITIRDCDFSKAEDLRAIATLFNMFIADEMGGGELLSEEEQRLLLEGLRNHPRAVVLLALAGSEYAGLLVGYENFSTFTAKPMLNIHDVFVRPEYRGEGVGRLMMNEIISEGGKRGCSRISLEVRIDNPAAQGLYQNLGFVPAEPDMYYWMKHLDN